MKINFKCGFIPVAGRFLHQLLDIVHHQRAEELFVLNGGCIELVSERNVVLVIGHDLGLFQDVTLQGI